MKLFLYHIVLLLAAMSVAGCVKDAPASEDAVEVRFSASADIHDLTRGGGNGYCVVCAVFEDGMEIRTLRDTVDISHGSALFSPRLIKGSVYDVSFWACKEGCYDVYDMTSIVRSSEVDGTGYDAFTAVERLAVDGGVTRQVRLDRPFASLNIGTSQAEWNCMVSQGLVPTSVRIKLEGKDTFDALAGMPSGDDGPLVYESVPSGDEFVCDGKTYRSIAYCHVYAEDHVDDICIEYSVYDRNGNPFCEDVLLEGIPLQRGWRTNVAGVSLTGSSSTIHTKSNLLIIKQNEN